MSAWEIMLVTVSGVALFVAFLVTFAVVLGKVLARSHGGCPPIREPGRYLVQVWPDGSHRLWAAGPDVEPVFDLLNGENLGQFTVTSHRPSWVDGEPG